MASGAAIYSFQYLSTGDLFAGLTTGSNLYLAHGSNPEAVAVYVQLFDGDPAPASVPMVSLLVPASGSFSYAPSGNGRSFPTKATFGVSSTPDTYTDAGTAVLMHAEGREQ